MLLRIKNLLLLIFAMAFLFSCSLDKRNTTEPDVTPVERITPNTPKPQDNSTDQLLVLTLDWSSDNEAKYDIYLDTKNPPQILFLKDADSKPIIKTGLDYNTTYYWKVVAKYNDGSRIEGPVWKFTTITQNNSNTGNGFALYLHSIKTALPNTVNALFQVSDLNGSGISNLQFADFEVYEDSQPLSLSESQLQINKYTGIPYTIKSVLMLDNSTSLTGLIDSIRNKAISFINNILPNQEVAIYQFSDEIEMLADFTSDKNVLYAALQNYQLGNASTNFYGAVVKGASLWSDSYSSEEIIQGGMIVCTDGNDTQGSSSLASAINAVHNKIVFTVGLGNEIKPEILDEVGTAGYSLIEDVENFIDRFNVIQKNITDYSNSFYLLSYKSPKRGNMDHYLTVRIKNNLYTGYNSVITGSFNSSGFTSGKVN